MGLKMVPGIDNLIVLEITPDILQRYNEGTATEAETLAVENWLTSTDVDTYVLDPVDLVAMRTAVWDNLLEQAIDERKDLKRIVTRRKNLLYRPLVAAMLLLLVGGVVFHKLGYTGFSTPAQDGLIITSARGPIEVQGDNVKVQFSGYLQVVNSSKQQKSIECTNGELYTLEPGETYYLETIAGRHYLIAERHLSPEDNYLRFVSGDVEVLAQTI
ncbi:hypothetical protein [Sphingobacterium yanglingense]|uniref:FecR family protein n=1 Tax=Sphingobacterium yanglingense TaxID=1437280 RepID=A0A4R6WFC0_9SPHI|nr:hypothetical protein [Sphingobacterium yanglingense]TDQ76320.1 hypothetical protein CLV99_2907 [Sphingobacterium yanglingense]